MYGPLKGIRILDLTRATAGPFGAMMLGDLGAEVIKIETPPGAKGLDSRNKLDPDVTIGGDDLHFLSLNRNKKSIILDLKKEEGREIFYELVKVSDVVFDNFRAGVGKKLAIDFESLKKINPKIICCSNTGFGASGPYESLPAFDIIILGLSGMLKVFDIYEKDGRLAPLPIPLTDLIGGMWSAYGIVAGLYAREKTNEGMFIDVSMLDGSIVLMGWLASYYLNSVDGRNPAVGHLYGPFNTKDKPIIIAAQREGFWRNLCKAIGKPELIEDERYNDQAKRLNHRDELRALIEEVLKEKNMEEWLGILRKNDVPCCQLNDLKDALSDPQLAHRNMIVQMERSNGEKVQMLGNPLKMSTTKEQVYSAPPFYGEQTVEILRNLLNYSENKINECLNNKVVY